MTRIAPHDQTLEAGAPPEDLRALTALRFVAALWVALYAFWPNLDVGFMPNLLAKGYLGVELFFVLSGFILCHVYLEAAGKGGFDYRSFLWARIARVYPLHLATLIGIGILGVGALAAGLNISSNVISLRSLPANLFMVHAWGLAPDAGWNHRSWSVSAEWFAYLCFPAFAFVAWRLRQRPFVAVGGAMALLAGLYLIFPRLTGFDLTHATIAWGALRIVPCFAFGCALYLVYRRGPLKQAGWIAAASAAALVVSATAMVWDGVIVALAGLLILALGSLPNARAGWLASKPAVYLGEISYSLYMIVVPWQLLSVNLLAKITGDSDHRLQLFVWLGLIACLPLIAAASYHLVEFPARQALRGWRTRRLNRPQNANYPRTAI